VVTKIKHEQEIERDFNYRGPKIARIEWSPPKMGDTTFWKNEVLTDSAYHVNFVSGKGNPAKASVKVYVDACDMPDNILSLKQYTHEIEAKQIAIDHLKREILDCDKTILHASSVVKFKGTELERLDMFQNSLNTMKTSREKISASLSNAKADQAKLVKIINENAEDFTFLKDYLEVCNDKKLCEKDVVSHFLKLDREFAKALVQVADDVK